VKIDILLDVLHALVHFQTFSDRLAPFWTEIVGLDTAQIKKQDKSELETVIQGGYDFECGHTLTSKGTINDPKLL
jgi:transcription-repair coupling factor (superfamily II helicase)